MTLYWTFYHMTIVWLPENKIDIASHCFLFFILHLMKFIKYLSISQYSIASMVEETQRNSLVTVHFQS